MSADQQDSAAEVEEETLQPLLLHSLSELREILAARRRSGGRA